MAKNKISDVSTQSIEVFGRNRSRKMFVKFVLCALFLRSVSGGLLPLNESDDSVTRVIERLFGINETVCIITDGIMIDVEFEIPNPKIIWNLNAPIEELSKQQPVYNFIIQVIDSNSLFYTLRSLFYNRFWYRQNTVRGTFLIIISEIDNVFKHLWSFSITNSVILVNGNGPSQCKLYQSIQRSLENGCGKKLNIMQEDCQDGPTLTFKKGFQSYHGCPIGYDKGFLRKHDIISFVDETKAELTKRYGVPIISGAGGIKYDVISGIYPAFTSEVEFKHYVWLIPLPKEVPPLKLYLIIFQEEVWIMVAVGFLLTIFFYVIILLYKRIPVNLSTFGFIIMEILSLTFWGCCSRIPNVTALRLLLLSYIFYAIVVQTGYVSNLVRVQTIPQFEPGIDSVRELIHSNIPIYWTALRYGEYDITQSLPQKATIQLNWLGNIEYIEKLSSIIADNHQAGAIMLHDTAISLMNKHKIIHNKLILDDSVLPTRKYAFYMSTDDYFFDTLNKLVIGLTENGVYTHLNRKENEILTKTMQSINYPTDPQVLKLDHVYGIFIIWGFGLSISFLVFILEIIVHKSLKVAKSNTIEPIAVTVEEEEVEIIDIEYTV